jgi:DNA helicase-2/ATP-dependent DNA helicase PcrA
MRSLSTAFQALNDDQKEAVLHPTDAVVLAGPGSGKTETLAIKVAHLLGTEVRSPRGVACITFGREAAEEFRVRLAAFGVRPNRRLFLGTVHGFCLTRIIRPYAALAGVPSLAKRTVASSEAADDLLLKALKVAGLPPVPIQYRSIVTRVRRSSACGETDDAYEEAELVAAREYHRSLQQNGLLDFESIVFAAKALVDRADVVSELLGARYPWLVVDEYQDMGGPLHQIVVALRRKAGMKVFAVGDPNQTIYDFNGANPRYLEELVSTEGIQAVRLRLNYRSGQSLIRASEAVLALDEPLGHLPHPGRSTLGTVTVHRTDGGLDEQLSFLARTLVPEIVASGTPPEQIAVLYRMAASRFGKNGPKASVLARIQAALGAAGVRFLAERDMESFPRGPIVQWLQECAGQAMLLNSESRVSVRLAGPVKEYRDLVRGAGIDVDRGEARELRRRMFRELERPAAADGRALDWLARVVPALGVRGLLQRNSSRGNDLETLDRLAKSFSAGSFRSMTLGAFAADGRLAGRVLVTTYHSSKGRQFDTVILPMLQDGLVPVQSWNVGRNSFDELGAVKAREERRLFYVAFTRARHDVHLLTGTHFLADNRVRVDTRPSRFIREIEDGLSV